MPAAAGVAIAGALTNGRRYARAAGNRPPPVEDKARLLPVHRRQRQPARCVRSAGCPGLGPRPIACTGRDTGHGRNETRILQVLPAPGGLSGTRTPSSEMCAFWRAVAVRPRATPEPT